MQQKSYYIDLAYKVPLNDMELCWSFDQQLEEEVIQHERTSSGMGFGLRDIQWILPGRPSPTLLDLILNKAGALNLEIEYCSCADYYEPDDEETPEESQRAENTSGEDVVFSYPNPIR